MADTITIDGDKKILRKMTLLKGSVQRKITRRAISKGCTIVLKSARRKAPVETKTLRKSLGRTTKTYRDGTVVGIVGPRVGKKNEVTGRNATRYAHLAERQEPYLRPAYDENKSQVQGIIRDEIAAGIEAEAKK